MANEFLTRNEEIVDGIYRLGALIRRTARSAIYETEFGEHAAPAVIKIREVDSAEAEDLRQRLRNAGQLAHPNLLKIYATGSSMLDDVPIFYVVMERADESLEEALARRALTPGETREILVPALDALQYLHNKGYAHSRLKPSNVLAVSDQLKLSTDSVIRLNDGGSADEDIRALGVLIVQALTQKIPNANESWESQDFEEIPQPLADIVRHCLDPDCARRWTVEQVNARLNAPAIEPLLPRGQLLVDAGGSKSGIPKWIYVGLATLILTVFLAAVVRRKDSGPVASPVAAATRQDWHAPATGPAIAEPGGSGGVASPRVTAAPRVTPAPRAEARPAGSRPDERKAHGWSVIVSAYGSREPAEKRMREMMKRWPKFEISVFETQAEKTHYLVVLGQNLSEDQAEALRKRAVEAGLGRNTYIKRVM